MLRQPQRVGERPYLARISVALRVVPGEFDLGWVGRIADAARAEPELHATLAAADVQARLTRLDLALKAAQEAVAAAGTEAESPALKDALGLSQHLLGRLRAGWCASGMWSSEALNEVDAAEVEAVEDELFFRMQAIERAARLRAGTLPEADAARLETLCEALRAYSW